MENCLYHALKKFRRFIKRTMQNTSPALRVPARYGDVSLRRCSRVNFCRLHTFLSLPRRFSLQTAANENRYLWRTATSELYRLVHGDKIRRRCSRHPERIVSECGACALTSVSREKRQRNASDDFATRRWSLWRVRRLIEQTCTPNL